MGVCKYIIFISYPQNSPPPNLSVTPIVFGEMVKTPDGLKITIFSHVIMTVVKTVFNTNVLLTHILLFDRVCLKV